MRQHPLLLNSAKCQLHVRVSRQHRACAHSGFPLRTDSIYSFQWPFSFAFYSSFARLGHGFVRMSFAMPLPNYRDYCQKPLAVSFHTSGATEYRLSFSMSSGVYTHHPLRSCRALSIFPFFSFQLHEASQPNNQFPCNLAYP